MERKIISESMVSVSQETIINRENQIHLFVDAIQYFKEISDKYINYIIELRNQYIDNLKNILNTFREFERNSDNIIYKIYFEKLNENFNKSKLNEFILTIQQPMPNIDYKVSTIKINKEILLNNEKIITPKFKETQKILMIDNDKLKEKFLINFNNNNNLYLFNNDFEEEFHINLHDEFFDFILLKNSNILTYGNDNIKIIKIKDNYNEVDIKYELIQSINEISNNILELNNGNIVICCENDLKVFSKNNNNEYEVINSFYFVKTISKFFEMKKNVIAFIKPKEISVYDLDNKITKDIIEPYKDNNDVDEEMVFTHEDNENNFCVINNNNHTIIGGNKNIYLIDNNSYEIIQVIEKQYLNYSLCKLTENIALAVYGKGYLKLIFFDINEITNTQNIKIDLNVIYHINKFNDKILMIGDKIKIFSINNLS